MFVESAGILLIWRWQEK